MWINSRIFGLKEYQILIGLREGEEKFCIIYSVVFLKFFKISINPSIFDIFFIIMAPKINSSDKRKDIETPIDYIRAKYTNGEAKLRFDKVVKINKKFIVEGGLDF